MWPTSMPAVCNVLTYARAIKSVSNQWKGSWQTLLAILWFLLKSRPFETLNLTSWTLGPAKSQLGSWMPWTRPAKAPTFLTPLNSKKKKASKILLNQVNFELSGQISTQEIGVWFPYMCRNSNYLGIRTIQIRIWREMCACTFLIISILANVSAHEQGVSTSGCSQNANVKRPKKDI